MRRDVWVVLACLAVGTAVGWFARFWYIRHSVRRVIRRKMRALGMIPVLAVGWCTYEVHELAAQSRDTVFTAPWITEQIGDSVGGPAVYCLTRYADWGSLLVIGGLAKVNPDTLTDAANLCDSRPSFWDRPTCPQYAPPVGAAPFILVRCERRWFRFPLRTPPSPRSL